MRAATRANLPRFTPGRRSRRAQRHLGLSSRQRLPQMNSYARESELRLPLEIYNSHLRAVDGDAPNLKPALESSSSNRNTCRCRRRLSSHIWISRECHRPANGQWQYGVLRCGPTDSTWSQAAWFCVTMCQLRRGDAHLRVPHLGKSLVENCESLMPDPDPPKADVSEQYSRLPESLARQKARPMFS